jgi:hypothetical protein
VIKHHESTISRVIYKYESKDERDQHVRDMYNDGWYCESKLELSEDEEWKTFSIAAEFIKQNIEYK